MNEIPTGLTLTHVTDERVSSTVSFSFLLSALPPVSLSLSRDLDPTVGTSVGVKVPTVDEPQ